MAAPKIPLLLLLLLSVGLPAAPSASRLRVEKGTFRPMIVLTGTLKASRSEEFIAPLTGTWQIQIKWMAREGDEVKAGDPVVRFDTANIATEIESAREALKNKLNEKRQFEADRRFKMLELEADFKSAENESKKKEIDAAIPEELLSRYEYEKRQLDSRRGGQTLESARKNRKVSLAEVEAQIKTADIEIDELGKTLAKLQKDVQGLVLHSRTAGPLIYDMTRDHKVQVGDTVYSTDTVAFIPDRSSLEVEAWVCETHIQQVKPGLRVALRLDAYPERLFSGVVGEVSRNAETRKQWGKASFFRVMIRPDQVDPEIMKPGMSVKCDVCGSPITEALLVPLAAVVSDGNGFWVQPDGVNKVKIRPGGFGDFFVALRPEENPAVHAGMTLVAPESAGGDDDDE
jgi:multidrug efflux pump subunit AcrA (membrane-fusion protein)